MKRLAGIAVSLLVMALIYSSLDRGALWENLRAARPVSFVMALVLFIPQNLVIAWRWRMIVSVFAPLPMSRALSQILACHSMNVLLPSKLGDFSKAWFLVRSGDLAPAEAAHFVIFEKLLDLGSLCLIAIAGIAVGFAADLHAPSDAKFHALVAATVVIGGAVLAALFVLYLLPLAWMPGGGGRISNGERLADDAGTLSATLPKWRRLITDGHRVTAALRRREARRGMIFAISILLWVLHLLQIGLFFQAMNAPVPPLPFVGLMPIAIFVGLLPLSLFGLGTRDAAIIYLFSSFHPAAVMAGVGLCANLRYIIPALAGLPFLQLHLADAKEMRAARNAAKSG